MKSCPKFLSFSKSMALPSPVAAAWANQPQYIKKSYRPTTTDNSSRMPSSRRELHRKASGLKTIRHSKRLTEGSSILLRGDKAMDQPRMIRTIKTIQWTGTSIQLTTTNWSSTHLPLMAPSQTRITSRATLLSWAPNKREDSSPLERFWE